MRQLNQPQIARELSLLPGSSHWRMMRLHAPPVEQYDAGTERAPDRREWRAFAAGAATGFMSAVAMIWGCL